MARTRVSNMKNIQIVNHVIRSIMISVDTYRGNNLHCNSGFTMENVALRWSALSIILRIDTWFTIQIFFTLFPLVRADCKEIYENFLTA